VSILIQLGVSAIMIIVAALICRYYWATRRLVVRKDAPTGDKPWTAPDPYRKH
jgi:hypothetical protein